MHTIKNIIRQKRIQVKKHHISIESLKFINKKPAFKIRTALNLRISAH